MDHGFTNLALPVLAALKAVGEGLVVRQGLVDILLRAEDEGAVLDDGLIQRSTCDEDCDAVSAKVDGGDGVRG